MRDIKKTLWFGDVENTLGQCTAALGNVCARDNAAGQEHKRRAAKAGALEAVVEAMNTHLDVADVQWNGCHALSNLCSGIDTGGKARDRRANTPGDRKQRAAKAGALEAVVAAMRAHRQVGDVQENACAALSSMCSGNGAKGRAHKQRAARAGALPAIRFAVEVHGCEDPFV